MRDYLLVVGLMTGNSIDGVDAVLTRFGSNGEIVDLCSHSIAMPDDIRNNLIKLRSSIAHAHGQMERAIEDFDGTHAASFDDVQGAYTELLARAVRELQEKAKDALKSAGPIDLIGSHGQTCAHVPPSVAGTSDKDVVYTVQIGDPQQLADATGITVVADFRSDDIMNGGEGAPLAPIHHLHLAKARQARGELPIAFCNAGNTGNISIVFEDTSSKELVVRGWDVGPFNNFTDKLMNRERGERMDKDAVLARRGRINQALLSHLFSRSVRNAQGGNFLLQAPPKSSDPEWYQLLPELLGEAPVNGEVLSLEDRVRTATFFSSYILVHSLSLLPDDGKLPKHFALCGGGWKNPLCREDFSRLLQGNDSSDLILEEHLDLFKALWTKLSAVGGVVIALSDEYGFDSTSMEARIFADAAVCRINGTPFTLPDVTGVAGPTVAGIVRFPGAQQSNATPALDSWLSHYQSSHCTVDDLRVFDGRWSRASAGWSKRVDSLMVNHSDVER